MSRCMGCASLLEEIERLRSQLSDIRTKALPLQHCIDDGCLGDKPPTHEHVEHRITVLLEAIAAAPAEEGEGMSEEAFTCPKCGCHRFGTDSSAASSAEWTVFCHRFQCNWSGNYSEHVRNDHLAAPAEDEEDDPDPLAWVEDSPWAEEGKT